VQASFQEVPKSLEVTYRPPGMREARDPINRLRTAIDCLPAETRRAMLDGIRTSPIVVGAYTDNRGGVCPMLAAQRLRPGRLRLPRPAQGDIAARMPSPKRMNVASEIR
jgi:hypothetical protein